LVEREDYDRHTLIKRYEIEVFWDMMLCILVNSTDVSDKVSDSVFRAKAVHYPRIERFREYSAEENTLDLTEIK
jgi:hypothetical protein